MADRPDPARDRRRRTILFCPGSRPERFAKALASGADCVCLDLEDGVAPDARDDAREAIIAYLSREEPHAGDAQPERMVRINHVHSEAGQRDLDALKTLGPDRIPGAVMVPKVEGPGELEEIARVLGSKPALLPLIETARALARVEDIAESRFTRGGLVFGGMDLAAELGARFEWEPLLYARSRIVHAAALAGLGTIDAAWTPLDDPAGLLAETQRAARLGYTGKLAIHPAQIATIHEGLIPDADELAAARRIVEAADRSTGGVLVVDGRMVDRPVVLGARRIVARAGDSGARPAT